MYGCFLYSLPLRLINRAMTLKQTNMEKNMENISYVSNLLWLRKHSWDQFIRPAETVVTNYN